MAHSGERPEGLAVALLLADTDVIPRHELTRVAVVDHLDARQPLDVGHTVPARGDQAHGEAVLRGQWLTVHFVAEQVAGFSASSRDMLRANCSVIVRSIPPPASGSSVPVWPPLTIPELSRIVTVPRSAP